MSLSDKTEYKADLMNRVAVLGGGGWGTALAIHLGRLDREVRLWARNESLIEEIQKTRVNSTYLQGEKLPSKVVPVFSLEDAVDGVSCVVCTIPSHGLREVIKKLKNSIASDTVVVSATKGIEVESQLRMSQVIQQELGVSQAVVVLSGPSFALELARGCPTAVSVAGDNQDIVKSVQQGLRSTYFRLYGTDDVVGVEMGGAMKNIIAIAAGTVESLDLGSNAQSALITRGLAEISRLAVAIGGRRETLSGLSGLGDLVLTCNGHLSRNRAIGLELGKGKKLEDILPTTKTVAEGIRTTAAALKLGSEYQVELPITFQMAEVIAGRTAPRVAVEELMLRRQRSEHEGE
tara:strand:+ start:1110 stop:2153 length:1044 start_codon:yes stop_codon:yes gene_type:complete